VLGVTGGIASGKTTVMRLLARRGIPTISSDDLAHACMRPGRPAYRAILRHFGGKILDRNDQINRRKLGEIVFAHPKKRKALEKIVHPCVIKGLKDFIGRHHKGVVALDIPLLFEARLTRLVDKTVVVYSTLAQQISRLRRRTGLSRPQALARIRAQMPLSRKRQKADHVLQNTGTLAHLRRQMDKWGFLKNT
jgi:dephospho-CoA kinase